MTDIHALPDRAMRLRALTTVIIVLGAVICRDGISIYFTWWVLFFVLRHEGIGILHARLTLTFIIPLALGATLIHAIAHYEDISGGWWERFSNVAPKAVLIAGRLGVVAAVTQWCIIPLTTDGRFISFLRSVGLKSRGVLILGATVTLLAEVRTRVRQILEARLAQGRGFGGILGVWLQLPVVLMPLMVNVLDTAAARADLWRARNLVAKLNSYVPPHQRPVNRNDVLGIILSLTWLVIAATGPGMFAP